MCCVFRLCQIHNLPEHSCSHKIILDKLLSYCCYYSLLSACFHVITFDVHYP